MTTPPTTLLAALEATTKLEIDGLHARDFSLGDELKIESKDGRERKLCRFTRTQDDAPTFDESL
ncbi:hypothetical protein RA262_28450, partial [Pseudomonas syringae pv. tagetis]